MGLKENLQAETVSDLPLREVIAVEAATKIRDAVAKMRAKQLGCAIIVGADGRPDGIFTERSVIAALVKGASLDDSTVGDFAEPNYLKLKGSECVRRAWDAVVRDGVRFICVTDDDGKLVGLTGQRGLAEYVSEHFPQQIMVQRLGSKPWTEKREGA